MAAADGVGCSGCQPSSALPIAHLPELRPAAMEPSHAPISTWATATNGTAAMLRDGPAASVLAVLTRSMQGMVRLNATCDACTSGALGCDVSAGSIGLLLC